MTEQSRADVYQSILGAKPDILQNEHYAPYLIWTEVIA
jgi:hypothetical protein